MGAWRFVASAELPAGKRAVKPLRISDAGVGA
jgi:hypothetical protein